jgi:hypothetical protein
MPPPAVPNLDAPHQRACVEPWSPTYQSGFRLARSFSHFSPTVTSPRPLQKTRSTTPCTKNAMPTMKNSTAIAYPGHSCHHLSLIHFRLRSSLHLAVSKPSIAPRGPARRPNDLFTNTDGEQPHQGQEGREPKAATSRAVPRFTYDRVPIPIVTKGDIVAVPRPRDWVPVSPPRVSANVRVVRPVEPTTTIRGGHCTRQVGRPERILAHVVI